MMTDKKEKGKCRGQSPIRKCTEPDLEPAPTHGAEETEEGQNTRSFDHSKTDFAHISRTWKVVDAEIFLIVKRPPDLRFAASSKERFIVVLCMVLPINERRPFVLVPTAAEGIYEYHLFDIAFRVIAV